jgi:peroxiredoxin
VKGAYEKYSQEGLQVIGLGFQDSEANIRQYAQKHAMPWPVGYDMDDRLAKLYGIPFGAGAAFIDREGIIRGFFRWSFDERMLEEELEKIL